MAKEKTYEKSYFIDMNIQNPPKPDPAIWYVRKADEDSVPEHTVEGWEFTLDIRDDSIGETEGFSPEFNFRMCFLPKEGHYWVSRDFAGQELRILANLAMEKTWIDTFLTGGDPHRATAEAVWGKENYDNKKRKQAKAINFGLVYGSTEYGIADALGITKEEAKGYIDEYFKKLPAIKRYLEKCERDGASNKEIANPYGRKRRLKTHIDSYGRLRPRGARIAYNQPVQSMGAEVTKLAMIKVHEKIVKPNKYGEDFYFLNTVHDEINTSIAFGIVKEAVYDLGRAMEHKIPGKPVPITTDIEIGHSMGLLWKFKQDPETLELTPDYEPIKESD